MAGQGGCDYFGGYGIQQAVDALPVGSSSNKSKIIIKSGNYKRESYTEYINSSAKKIKCFVNTREKFLIFEGEMMPVLNGEDSANMSGFCAKGGEIEIKNLVIRGFKKDEDSCLNNNSQNPCSRGFGIHLEGNVKATITNNQITGNQANGIILFNSSSATITNNQITGNQKAGIYLRNSTSATIVNNTISFNRVAGIDLYSCSNENPSVIVKNNIITNAYKNTDNTFGFGIGGSCLHYPSKLANDTFSYNLIWGNLGENTSCIAHELCENFTGRINADPQYINVSSGDFRLKSTSPAIDSGDPSIADQDGSRSDMGAWGGPNPLPLVLNGGFELGWFGWVKNEVGLQEIVIEGSRGKVLHQKNDNSGSRVIQWVPIKNDKVYRLSLDLKGGGNVGNGPLAAAHESCLGGASGNRFIKGFSFSLSQSWQNKKWIFKSGNCAQDQDHRLAIFFDTNNENRGEIWVDNVAIESINPYRQKGYFGVIIAQKPIVADYSYSDGAMSMTFLNKGQALESASEKVFLPRVLKGAYKKDPNDGGFHSGIVVMNTENRNTNFKLKIYRPDGANVLKEYSFSLNPYGGVSIWPPSYNDWPTNPDDPPAIIEADGKVVVSVDLRNQINRTIPGSGRGASYEGIGIEGSSKTWYIPVILRNAYNEGWESGLVIQNTENSPASLTISLYGLDNDYQKTCMNISLAPHGQRKIYFPDRNSNNCFTELIDNPSYNNNKKYSGKIISDKNIAVVVSLSSISGRKSIEENAIPQEKVGSKIFVPRVYNNYYGWISSFTLQNVSNSNCRFNVKYISKEGLIQTGTNSCSMGNISPLKSIIIFPPNMGGLVCIPEGNSFYSAIVENCSLAGFYHLSYPKDKRNDDFINRAAGASTFSEREASTIFFIPRIYFYSYNWQSGLQIQNTVNENNKFNLYILNDKGKIIARRENVGLSQYQAISYYMPDDFFNDLLFEPEGTDYPSVATPTGTPTQTITPTPTPTRTPTPTPNPNCVCLSTGVCHDSCPVNNQSNYWGGASSANISYTQPMRCGLNNDNIFVNPPSDDQKNQFCRRYLRPKGDVDGDGQISFITDYLYYIQAFSGGKVASNINLDVNGNGEVTPDDGAIIRANIQQ